MRPKKKVRFDGSVRVEAPIALTGITLCGHCGRRHPDECWRMTRACLRCGSIKHHVRECLLRADQVQATDTGSTHSYVACSISKNLGIPVESTSSEVIVLSPLGQSIRVRKLYRDIFLEVQGMVFLADLMELPFGRVRYAKKLVRKGYEAYLAYVSVSAFGDFTIKDIRTMRDFPDVFLEELLSLPLNREVEFGIELLPGTTLVSISPYRMAPKEFTELKAQIQELSDCRFICPSVSP
ncbi:uncharacterized protein [Gossypium hirsutum]|uniref:DNA/RNA polymerases superfamily protein n=1 Tax=Gossypium hirsutum TaxID=3635 RepID=A0A1U8JKJ1_GOSHI|nr:uncharacterized protein LOC107908047 [Gossypium hirsutum]